MPGGRVTQPIAGADRLLRSAIAERRLVAFVLDGCRRIAEPHDYGVMNGELRLFFYQTGGESRSGRPFGWRWAILSKISGLQVLDERFAGAREAPSGRHVQWDTLLATVSPRSVSESEAPSGRKAGRSAGRKR
jgi:hypothetical protein